VLNHVGQDVQVAKPQTPANPTIPDGQFSSHLYPYLKMPLLLLAVLADGSILSWLTTLRTEGAAPSVARLDETRDGSRDLVRS